MAQRMTTTEPTDVHVATPQACKLLGYGSAPEADDQAARWVADAVQQVVRSMPAEGYSIAHRDTEVYVGVFASGQLDVIVRTLGAEGRRVHLPRSREVRAFVAAPSWATIEAWAAQAT